MPLEAPAGYLLAPIHSGADLAPLKLCLLIQVESMPPASPFVLLREVPGSRVYLGAICDPEARIQEWVEICAQSLDIKEMAFSSYQEQLSNFVFDQRWQSECALFRDSLPAQVIATPMERENPSPVLIKQATQAGKPSLATAEVSRWKLCKDNAQLESLGLPPYTTSPFRYLYDPEATGAKSFIAITEDAPTNAHVQNLERLTASPDIRAVFNPHAGLIRIMRYGPLELESFLQVLEGGGVRDLVPDTTRLFPASPYARLRAWSASPKGLPFLLHGAPSDPDRLSEIFFLKLAAMLEMFKAVRTHVGAHQLPMLNLAPGSFRVSLPEVGDQFPSLWAAHCELVKPGQAYPLKIRSTDQRYFVRLGRAEPSPYLPEGLGAHSFGVGSVRVRNVLAEADGSVLEGTLVAEDYLGLDPHDLLWFKIPLGEQRLEFFAHVYVSEAVGPREARFRTVPTRLQDASAAALQRAAGTVFARSPYEIWPLLSSPCDMFSLGVMSVRVLLANNKTNLPVILDEVLGLARHLGKEGKKDEPALARLKSAIEKEKRLLDLISPHQMIEAGLTPQEARNSIPLDLWMEAIAFLLRLFPGAGTHSYCKDLGDVSPLALETIFDQPIEELERLVFRLRATLLPTLHVNEEIAAVILQAI
jgi:hypothetical protein